MRLSDSFKHRYSPSGKVLPASATIARVLRKLHTVRPPVLHTYRRFQNPLRMPHYRVWGSDEFLRVAGSAGANGKGLSWDMALASGLMELVERYSCYTFLRRQWHGDCPLGVSARTQVFAAFLRNFPDPACFGPTEEVSAFLAKQYFRWYPVWDLEGKRSWLPLGFFCFVLAGGNGMDSGNTREEALLHGICEVVERHCLALVDIRRLSVPTVVLDKLPARLSRLVGLVRHARQEILVKDYSCGLGIPAIGVLRNVSPSHCVLNVGVASSPQEALGRALTESAQTETKANWQALSGMKHHFKAAATVPLTALAGISSANIKDEIYACEKGLQAKGMRLFFADAAHRRLGMPSVIVHIQGALFSQQSVHPAESKPPERPLLMGLLNEACAAGKQTWLDHCAGLGTSPGSKAMVDLYQGAFLWGSGYRTRALKYFVRVMRNRDVIPECRNMAADFIRESMLRK